MPSDSDRIFADGAAITLADGQERRLRFGMRALKTIEDSFGSVNAVGAILGGANPKVIGPLVTLMAAGLSHERLSEDDVLDLMDPRALDSYMAALGKAINEAFPDASPTDNPGKVPGSHGPTTTTLPPSGSGEAMRTSHG